ncbi:hypothetical protein CDAR_192651, partial [Caerostris darwini]
SKALSLIKLNKFDIFRSNWQTAVNEAPSFIQKHRQVEDKSNKSFGFLVGWGDVSPLSVLNLAAGAVATHHPARGGS